MNMIYIIYNQIYKHKLTNLKTCNRNMIIIKIKHTCNYMNYNITLLMKKVEKNYKNYNNHMNNNNNRLCKHQINNNKQLNNYNKKWQIVKI